MNNEEALSRLEDDFLTGNIAALQGRGCPRCGARLLYSVSVAADEYASPAALTGQVKAGISIYCLGRCNTLLSHLDGFCPAWAERIADWDAFSASLYR